MADPERGPAGSRRRPPVGSRVRQWRAERGRTIRDVAEAAGINGGYLSQIENDKASPSLETLVAIADVLDVPLHWLVLNESPAVRLVRAGERETWLGEGGVAMSDVSGRASRDIRVIELVGTPGGRTGLHAHEGEEAHYVLEGRFRLTYGDTTIVAGPGDFFAWDGTIPHGGEMADDQPGRLLIITRNP
jgi:transcriptional regulator with XRE-family HTH domain